MNDFLHYLPDDKPFDSVDVLLISGDVYIDHPSFGIAVIARLLESLGLSVCIASQPRYYDENYLSILPEPRLFIGVSSGNLDSIVSNYSANRVPRKEDAYSINNEAFFENGKRRRPDRAVAVYSAFIKRRFKSIPVIIGGLEASIRRFAHYDFLQQKLRKSVLADSKDDLLVYSMGEKALCDIVDRLRSGKDLYGINGTMVRIGKKDFEDTVRADINPLLLPSFDEIEKDRFFLVKSTAIVESNMVPGKAKPIAQDQRGIFVLAFPPQAIMNQDELDNVYNLPFRKDFPDYCKDVPAWNMIKDSITSHRGCYGNCSFCAISIHQGPVITQRSEKSIVEEVERLSNKSFFKKTVSDVGGPTANMYGTSCRVGWCPDPHCLFPEKCQNLSIDQKSYIKLLSLIKKLNGVKNVFVSSGIRHDLAMCKKEETEFLICECTSGHLKIAPEHINDKILELMRKPGNGSFIKFIGFFNEMKEKHNLNFYILPYLILSFPGSDDQSVKELGDFLNKNLINTRQYQDFTPVPGTMATAFYYAGTDQEGNKIEIPGAGKRSQRDILKKMLMKKDRKT